MATTRQQPPWQPPPEPSPDSDLPQLRISNSLTKRQDRFVPIDSKNRKVTWYACGPTVYDDAHLGHARNYVSTDIIRRIMKNYFKYDVRFVMNITDVDDKIILRGRQQHLLLAYLAGRLNNQPPSESVRKSALEAYLAKNLPNAPKNMTPKDVRKRVEREYADVLAGKSLDGVQNPGDREAKLKMHIKTVISASEAMVALENGKLEETSEEFQAQVQDVLLPYLDSLYGSSIDANDHSIFTKLTQKFERRFMEDVRSLNCLDPDEVTRVTEYGPQIVDFVKKIEENAFGYKTSDGSVYFDIDAFEAANNNYARLEPWNRHDKSLQADGEGALTQKTTEKRSAADFALWKSSRPGEPSWPSPWGNGRPGWHIECSAMASDKLGSQIDIHSGGIDLAFPHHDNELAQSEAYWLEKGQNQHQWVNYFMHMGHLSIQGSKMSKSLKNFTTIREALSRGTWTPRGLRIVFLLGNWAAPIEITDDLVKEGSTWEEKVNNFFLNAKDAITKTKESPEQEATISLEKVLDEARQDTDEALCNSFDTRTVMNKISTLITEYNSAKYGSIATDTTVDIARWITSVVNTFGLNGNASPDSQIIGWSGIDIPEAAVYYVHMISQLRDELRSRARSTAGLTTDGVLALIGSIQETAENQDVDTDTYRNIWEEFKTRAKSLDEPSSISKDILTLCDRTRDVDLWDVGIYLEDRENEPALIRPVTRELRAARQEKEGRERQKQLAKEKREKDAAARLEKGRISHLEMYKTDDMKKEFSAWDEQGIPTKDAKGEDLTKSKLKKLKKDWDAQKTLHEKWENANGSKA